ncbi:hypothetical protein Pmani_021328 [Petrolisthes manimaculis]|uniref:Uncharacterized protein n=1 Tax=Petrolisthes manimaculis TaxID=1843537 RepID=A0AAE1PF07_9EUCA|nr:hypothetical protein Pmani_027543 [Petrolisthes manimaculis]KAK4306878.1 hypothetical protein Pmani_021328 [Petrolisthes manimaculis]
MGKYALDFTTRHAGGFDHARSLSVWPLQHSDPARQLAHNRRLCGHRLRLLNGRIQITSTIHQNLEYTSVIWSPMLKRDKEALEYVNVMLQDYSWASQTNLMKNDS